MESRINLKALSDKWIFLPLADDMHTVSFLNKESFTYIIDYAALLNFIATNLAIFIANLVVVLGINFVIIGGITSKIFGKPLIENVKNTYLEFVYQM